MLFLSAGFEGDANSCRSFISTDQTQNGCKELIFPFLFSQERLSYIGPEEFVQAFVQKDPLDNDKVTSACFAKNKPPDKGSIYSHSYTIFFG